MSSLSKAELRRYSRQVVIPEFGIEGQQRLKRSKVLVVGTGALGAPVLSYITAAGIGTLGIIDFDVVEESNLQRQVLFTTADLGRSKVEAASERLQKQNPHVNIRTYNEKLQAKNVCHLMDNYDIVVDCTDNFSSRYLINDACVKLGKVCVYGSVFSFEGQVSVFNYQDSSGDRGPNLRDLFPTPPALGSVPNCEEGGVIGALPGIVGSIQACEVIKLASGIGKPLSGRLFTIDGLTMETSNFKLICTSSNTVRSTNAESIELVDAHVSCANQNEDEWKNVKSISAQNLRVKLNNQEDIQVIDVREPHEYEVSNIDGNLIPLSTVLNSVSQVNTDRPVIVHCRSGARSAQAIILLQKEYGLSNLYNLEGGLLAYSGEIDTPVNS